MSCRPATPEMTSACRILCHGLGVFGHGSLVLRFQLWIHVFGYGSLWLYLGFDRCCGVFGLGVVSLCLDSQGGGGRADFGTGYWRSGNLDPLWRTQRPQLPGAMDHNAWLGGRAGFSQWSLLLA